MFEQFWDILDYLFPVYIVNRDDVLVIEDRRPTSSMFFSVLLLLAAIVVAIWGWLSATLKLDALSFITMGGILGAALYFCIRGTVREVYVFDRSKDTYIFTRQGVFKKDVIQGSASQFRAAEVLRQISKNDDNYINESLLKKSNSFWVSYIYRAALLQNPELLLGTDEIQILREQAPIFSSHKVETRTVAAIASFLKITDNGTVDSL